MPQLHETQMGKNLIDHTLPKIAKNTDSLPRIATALERIADALEKMQIQEGDNFDISCILYPDLKEDDK